MIGTSLLLIGILGIGPNEYLRPLNAKKLDQPTLDAEGYGEKKAFKREDDGLRITLAPGEKETGWKTPQATPVRWRLHDQGDRFRSASFPSRHRKMARPSDWRSLSRISTSPTPRSFA